MNAKSLFNPVAKDIFVGLRESIEEQSVTPLLNTLYNLVPHTHGIFSDIVLCIVLTYLIVYGLVNLLLGVPRTITTRKNAVKYFAITSIYIGLTTITDIFYQTNETLTITSLVLVPSTLPFQFYVLARTIGIEKTGENS